MPDILDNVTFIWTQSQLRTVREFKRHENSANIKCQQNIASMCYNYNELFVSGGLTK